MDAMYHTIHAIIRDEDMLKPPYLIGIEKDFCILKGESQRFSNKKHSRGCKQTCCTK